MVEKLVKEKEENPGEMERNISKPEISNTPGGVYRTHTHTHTQYNAPDCEGKR